ncbi:hypothetical protein UlMin_002847 [Ulmus minor]
MFRMNKLQRLKTGGSGGRISAWVDSMRASSPPRVKSTSSHSETDEKKSWTHPSALSMFEQIKNASKGKHIVMFLDYDGTLSSIVEDRNRAFMSNMMRKAVRAVTRYFPTAIVSGRCRDKGVLCQPATEFLPMVNEVYKILLDETTSIPGARVEHSKFYISVHFRCVDEKKMFHRWKGLLKKKRKIINNIYWFIWDILGILETLERQKPRVLQQQNLNYARMNEYFLEEVESSPQEVKECVLPMILTLPQPTPKLPKIHPLPFAFSTPSYGEVPADLFSVPVCWAILAMFRANMKT